MPKKKPQLPLCTYGAACTRPGCIYRHPPKGAVRKSEIVCKPFLSGLCEFGSTCQNIHPGPEEADKLRRKYALIACEWGSACKNRGCLYRHPAPVDTLAATLATASLGGGAKHAAAAAPVGGELAAPASGQRRMPLLAGGVWQEDLLETEAAAEAAEVAQAAGEEAAGADPPPAQPLDLLLCAECASDSAAGAIDPDDGLFYCDACWRAFEAEAAPPRAVPQGAPSPPRGEGAAVAAAGSWAGRVGAAASALPSEPTARLPPPPRPTPPRVVRSSREVRIPAESWVDLAARAGASAFAIADPMERFAAVNRCHRRPDGSVWPLTLLFEDEAGGGGAGGGLVDLHFQSRSTVSAVLEEVLPPMLSHHAEVWVVTGSGHHVAQRSHQKQGGVLWAAVDAHLGEALPGLSEADRRCWYSYHPAKDHNGYHCAFLVRRRRR